jgi:hypothetical protein
MWNYKWKAGQSKKVVSTVGGPIIARVLQLAYNSRRFSQAVLASLGTFVTL